MGEVKGAIERLIKSMGDLNEDNEALSTIAVALAAALDNPKTHAMHLAGLSRELRQVMQNLRGEFGGEKDNGWGDMGSPD